MPEIARKDSAEFRSRVGEVAAVLYANGGEAAISIRQVARAVGASPMGLYRHFESRDAIITFLRTRAFNRFASCLEAAFSRGREPHARARAVGLAYLEFALENPSDYRLMFDMQQPNTRAKTPLARASARASLTIMRHVNDLVKAGIVAGDPDQIGRSLWAAAHGVIVLYLAGRLPRDADVREVYFDTMRLAFRGARPAEAAPAVAAKRAKQ